MFFSERQLRVYLLRPLDHQSLVFEQLICVYHENGRNVDDGLTASFLTITIPTEWAAIKGNLTAIGAMQKLTKTQVKVLLRTHKSITKSKASAPDKNILKN